MQLYRARNPRQSPLWQGADRHFDEFQAKVIQFLVARKLLPPERAQVLRSWKHSGFNVHHGDRVEPDAKGDLEDLAQYILRNPFAVEKMTPDSAFCLLPSAFSSLCPITKTS